MKFFKLKCHISIFVLFVIAQSCRCSLPPASTLAKDDGLVKAVHHQNGDQDDPLMLDDVNFYESVLNQSQIIYVVLQNSWCRACTAVVNEFAQQIQPWNQVAKVFKLNCDQSTVCHQLQVDSLPLFTVVHPWTIRLAGSQIKFEYLPNTVHQFKQHALDLILNNPDFVNTNRLFAMDARDKEEMCNLIQPLPENEVLSQFVIVEKRPSRMSAMVSH